VVIVAVFMLVFEFWALSDKFPMSYSHSDLGNYIDAMDAITPAPAFMIIGF